MNFQPQDGFVIGEIGLVNEGKLDRLLKLIDIVHDGGRNFFIKFQIYETHERIYQILKNGHCLVGGN